MNIEEICNFINSKLADSSAELVSNKAGDPYIIVDKNSFLDVCKLLKNSPVLDLDFLRLITAVDFQNVLSSVYHLYSYKHKHSLTLRVDLDRSTPEIPSVCSLWAGANWLERECFDMMGMVFVGHPDLKRILLPLDWDGFPLRKDYKQADEYHGIKNV